METVFYFTVSHRGSISGLTRAYMKQYVESHDPKKLADFYALCGLDESGKKQELAAAASQFGFMQKQRKYDTHRHHNGENEQLHIADPKCANVNDAP